MTSNMLVSVRCSSAAQRSQRFRTSGVIFSVVMEVLVSGRGMARQFSSACSVATYMSGGNTLRKTLFRRFCEAASAATRRDSNHTDELPAWVVDVGWKSLGVRQHGDSAKRTTLAALNLVECIGEVAPRPAA